MSIKRKIRFSYHTAIFRKNVCTKVPRTHHLFIFEYTRTSVYKYREFFFSLTKSIRYRPWTATRTCAKYDIIEYFLKVYSQYHILKYFPIKIQKQIISQIQLIILQKKKSFYFSASSLGGGGQVSIAYKYRKTDYVTRLIPEYSHDIFLRDGDIFLTRILHTFQGSGSFQNFPRLFNKTIFVTIFSKDHLVMCTQ